MTITDARPAIAGRRQNSSKGKATRKDFVERFAIAQEGDGLPRIAGRIFGLLLTGERDLSLDEITRELGASKGSASVNTRLLEQRGFIERISRPGDRRDYYRIMPDLFERTMEQRLAKWHRLHDVVEFGMSAPDLSPTVRNRLKNFEAAQNNIREVIETALTRLRTRRRR
ncbi:MAG TPA: MarR family transcriptional regulator [Gemmatimonadaceae bacterium]|jgi:DNA-binding transcriptional regulator GbsR (MarR family)|nr:MarR family transcriptional regulator [Gemmatimonadaceae bacterium]